MYFVEIDKKEGRLCGSVSQQLLELSATWVSEDRHYRETRKLMAYSMREMYPAD